MHDLSPICRYDVMFCVLQLGHMPQEDYAEAIHEPMLEFIKEGSS